MLHRDAPRTQEVGAVGAQVAEHLIEKPIRPLRVCQAREPDPDRHIAQRGGVKHVGVVDDDLRHGRKAHMSKSARRMRMIVERGSRQCCTLGCPSTCLHRKQPM